MATYRELLPDYVDIDERRDDITVVTGDYAWFADPAVLAAVLDSPCATPAAALWDLRRRVPALPLDDPRVVAYLDGCSPDVREHFTSGDMLDP